MSLYHIVQGKGFLEDVEIMTNSRTEARTDTDALRAVCPDFKWTFAVYNRIKGCMVYSSPSGIWAEVKRVFDAWE